MRHEQYCVVLHQGDWKIRHNGEYSASYGSQKQAIDAAVQAARYAFDRGRNSQVLVRRADNSFRTEWTYGGDPKKHWENTPEIGGG